MIMVCAGLTRFDRFHVLGLDQDLELRQGLVDTDHFNINYLFDPFVEGRPVDRVIEFELLNVAQNDRQFDRFQIWSGHGQVLQVSDAIDRPVFAISASIAFVVSSPIGTPRFLASAANWE
jgi:hypothetical protein